MVLYFTILLPVSNSVSCFIAGHLLASKNITTRTLMWYGVTLLQGSFINTLLVIVSFEWNYPGLGL